MSTRLNGRRCDNKDFPPRPPPVTGRHKWRSLAMPVVTLARDRSEITDVRRQLPDTPPVITSSSQSSPSPALAIPVICAFNLRNRDRLQPTVTPCRAAPARFASCTIIELFWKIRYWKFSADTKRIRETVHVIGTKKRIPNRYC